MNNRGQSIMVGVVFGIMIFISGILLLNFVELETDRTIAADNSSIAGVTGLNCGPTNSSNMSLSDGTKLTCLGLELVVPYFILAIASAAGGLIAGRFI